MPGSLTKANATTPLRDELASRFSHHDLSTFSSFADFCWDPDLTIDEILSLDPVVVIDSRTTPRRLVAQRIRGQLRYWIVNHRDPMEASKSGENELGWVEDFEALVALGDEFLDGQQPISELATWRFGRGRWRGKRR